MSVVERPICRRCKKKRPLDEPLETARYRTCKPCREIERKKKRLKKLEQTSGMARDVQLDVLPKPSYVDQNIINIANQVQRAHQMPQQYQQFQQQLPPVLAPIHQQQQDAQQQQQQLLQQHQQQQVQAAAQQAQQQAQHAAAQAQAAAAVAVAQKQDSDIPIDELLLKQGVDDDQDKQNHHEISAETIEAIARGANVKDDDKDSQDNDDSNLFAALKNANKSDDEEMDANARLDSHPHAKESDANICLYCGAIRDITDNGRYQLCGNCVENPLETDNVFDDFNSYLGRIALGKIADMKNLIFIRKFVSNEFVSNFVTYGDGSNNLDIIVEQLSNQFVNPLIENSGFKFSKSSSNLSVKPQPKSIKLLFKCKQDIKTMQKAQNYHLSRLKTEDCQSNVYISYDIFSKYLSIKFNHKNHKPFLEKVYSASMIERVRDLSKTEPDLNEVYNILRANSYLSTIDDEELKNEITQLKKVIFVKDFSNF